MSSPLSLRQALLLSSQSKASLLIEVPGNVIDYRLVVSCTNEERDEYELEVFLVRDGQIAPTHHKSLPKFGLDNLIEFVSSNGFVAASGWIAEEVITHE